MKMTGSNRNNYVFPFDFLQYLFKIGAELFAAFSSKTKIILPNNNVEDGLKSSICRSIKDEK